MWWAGLSQLLCDFDQGLCSRVQPVRGAWCAGLSGMCALRRALLCSQQPAQLSSACALVGLGRPRGFLTTCAVQTDKWHHVPGGRVTLSPLDMGFRNE